MSRERNFQIELVIALIVVTSSYVLNITEQDFEIILVCIALVLSLEMMNTAIEKLCDAILGKEYNVNIKIIKDIAAGAVLLASALAAVVGAIVFIKYL